MTDSTTGELGSLPDPDSVSSASRLLTERDAEVATVRRSLPPRQTGAVPAILPAERMRSQAAHEALDRLRAALVARDAELAGLRERLSLTAKALTWFYTDHVEDGDPPCPCEGCEKARVAFTANLAPLPAACAANKEQGNTGAESEIRRSRGES